MNLKTDIEHTIGNALFAIETCLQPLEKRINESNTKEALEILDIIRNSIENAKRGLFNYKDINNE